MPRSSKEKHNRGRVKRLWERSKKCHWCSKETRIQESGIGVAQHDTATFDHLYHRSEPERKIHPNRGVLACYECNQRRGREAYIKTLPVWNQWLIAINIHKPVYRIKKRIFDLVRKGVGNER
jgi:hypothetical protein